MTTKKRSGLHTEVPLLVDDFSSGRPGHIKLVAWDVAFPQIVQCKGGDVVIRFDNLILDGKPRRLVDPERYLLRRRRAPRSQFELRSGRRPYLFVPGIDDVVLGFELRNGQ